MTYYYFQKLSNYENINQLGINDFPDKSLVYCQDIDKYFITHYIDQPNAIEANNTIRKKYKFNLLDHYQLSFVKKALQDCNNSIVVNINISLIQSVKNIDYSQIIDTNDLNQQAHEQLDKFPIQSYFPYYITDKNGIRYELQFTNNLKQIISSQTKFLFNSNTNILTGDYVKPIELKNFNITNLKDLGIGGLDSKWQEIYRRVFLSRLFPEQFNKQYNIQHLKGVILYGPPGTGKTLIARKIGQLLNVSSCTQVSGPEMLNKYVGSSEENVRNLFKESKSNPEGLHLIIIDEIECIIKQRSNQDTNHTDSVVNQFLAEMDGLNTLNNFIIIGLTNRIDLIDRALLRPGRFELQLEIPLPNEEGREEIYQIHTQQIPNVDIHQLAQLSKNFSGADIKGVVNNAISFAQLRFSKDQDKQFEVQQQDFLLAIQQSKPSFGSDFDIQEFQQEKEYQDYINNFQSILISSNNLQHNINIAKTIAVSQNTDFIKIISIKTINIEQVFLDAIKINNSVIIIERLEDIIEYINYSRFNSSKLSLIINYIKEIIQNKYKILVITTTSIYSKLNQCIENFDIFQKII